MYVVAFAGAALGVALVWFLVEKSKRKTHPVSPGYREEVVFPHDETFELYHNALSLCSMKTRLCLAELQIPYKSHPIDLIETGRYENIRPRFLRINPGGTVPVLLHEGHPIYESHEQIRYAAGFAPHGVPAMTPSDPERYAEMETWIDRSSLTEDPLNHGDQSAGNAIPGQTVPLFSTMIEKIPFLRIFEGLLFHFDKFRPVLFMVLKVRGIENLHKLPPAVKAIGRSRAQLATHLDALEQGLERSGGPWILGDEYSLADVSWLVIFERLRQVNAEGVFLGAGKRPRTTEYWQRLQQRPAYTEAILKHDHPLIEYGRQRIVEAKAANEQVRICLEGV